MGLGYGIQDRARETARSQRIPRDESDPVLFAILQHIFTAAIDEIVSVLHGRHLEDLRGGFDVSNRYVT
jgi:hypothetical protein